MKILILTFILLMYNTSVFSKVSEETLFGQTYIFKGPYDSLMQGGGDCFSGGILCIHGAEQFSRNVFQNQRPVVLKVFNKKTGPLLKNRVLSKKLDKTLTSLYKEVASEFRGKVDFLSIDISHYENHGVIKNIVSQLGGGVFSLPFFLFFKQNELMIPPLVFPHFFGMPPQSMIDKIKDDFILYIKKRFFLKEQSTLEKIEQLSKKVSRLLSGLQNISKNEVKAYQLSKK